MAIILSIESSTSLCSVALHTSGVLVGFQKYQLQNAHSSLLPGIIDQLLTNSGVEKTHIEAVCVSAGPGSYTGLRIGTSAAKGLCLGLNVPLISVSSLDSLYEAIKNVTDAFVCPMIDARRMEVYCYLKNRDGQLIWDTHPLVVDENTFDEFEGQKVVLIGTGAPKLRSVLKSANVIILNDYFPQADFMGRLAFEKFEKSDFEDLAYFEPDYLKEFQTKIPN